MITQDHMTFEYFSAHYDGLHEWLRERNMDFEDIFYVLFCACEPNEQQAIKNIMEDKIIPEECSPQVQYVGDFFGKNGVLGIAYIF